MRWFRTSKREHRLLYQEIIYYKLHKRYKRQLSKAVINDWIWVHRKTGRILHDAVSKYILAHKAKLVGGGV